MSEVMISRRGGSSSSGSGSILHTEYITFSQNWVVPSGVKNNEYSVRIFGSGASYGREDNGGGSGWMNNDVFTNLIPGQLISIYIANAINGGSGESSSFGSYLSANGGKSQNGGAGGVYRYDKGGIGYQFGGGVGNYGGDGGVWGGGGGGWWNGGKGGTYGGGGGTCINGGGGNGGTYGGGGGGGISRTMSKFYGPGGNGGTYGGNGGYTDNVQLFNNLRLYYTNSTNGINTSTWTNVFNDGNGYFRGWGIGGDFRTTNSYNVCGGGGGYGGNGGISKCTMSNIYWYHIRGGGGGGYGSNGGGSFIGMNYGNSGGAGGGGGYGGDGGTGGGGYGKQSIGGGGDTTNGGGGGYYCPGGGKNATNGGGGFGIWDGTNLLISFASGSNGSQISEPGVCVIQYYI